LYGGNEEIIAIIETYDLSVSVYFVAESQNIQPLTITVDGIVAERHLYPECFPFWL
jgi:hypothetical protein